MTLLILWPLGAGAYGGLTIPISGAAEALVATRREHPDAFLSEPLTGNPAKGALPGELARAIEAWNAMPQSVTAPRLRGNLTRLVAPYRKWKEAAGDRDYLLEQLVADVEATPFCWGWIRFPWLFGKKNGELNSEKLHGEVARGGWRDAPDITERQFAQMAARAAKWRELWGADGSEAGFARDVGVSSAKFAELRQRFDPQAAAE